MYRKYVVSPKYFNYSIFTFLISILGLAACTSIPIDRTQPQYAHLPTAHVLENVPYFPQVEDQCGSSSLATLLAYRGMAITPEQLRDKIYIPGKQGSVTTEMIARARQFGLLSYPLAPNFSDVLSEIYAGNPVLVMQNLGYGWLPRWHFSVAMAFDLEKDTIRLRSGYEAKHDVPIGLFMKTWGRADRWAMIAVPPNTLPATATVQSATFAASQLEQVGKTRSAFTAYKTILQQWPEAVTAAFGAGNTAYGLADYTAARHYFSRYLRLDSQAHQGWNNLAYTLRQLDCPMTAKRAIDCALQLAPNDENVLDSARELRTLPNIERESVLCSIPVCRANTQ